VSLSSYEAEYQALSEGVQEAMMTQSLVQELIEKKTTSIIYNGNLGAFYLVKNMQVPARTKNIEIRHHFMRSTTSKR
jgi:hypothetical protein